MHVHTSQKYVFTATHIYIRPEREQALSTSERGGRANASARERSTLREASARGAPRCQEAAGTLLRT